MEYISISETAKKWGVTKAFVWNLARAGRIPGAAQIDGKWRIPMDAEKPTNRIMAPKTGYISTIEAAEKWGITQYAVCTAARNGRIPGAELVGGRWHIPGDTKKPVDRRSERTWSYSSPERVDEKEHTNIPELAKKLGVTQSVLYNALNEGRIPGAKLINGKWYVPQVVENPIKRQPTTNAGYISTREAAEKWGVVKLSVQIAAKEGRIPGAKFINGRWHIPEDMDNPFKIVMDVKPGYISVKEAATKWGVDQTVVRHAAKAGRIPGAEFVGNRWHIPEDSECPIVRRRTKKTP